MLETAITGASGGQDTGTAPQKNQSKKVLHWRVNERMGGKVPVWETRDTAQEKIADKLSDAHNTRRGESFDNALAYADAGGGSGAQGDEEAFGFGDLIDMVNPLHHLPIVGTIYREITGDEIKPIGKIIGGGVFGGPAGAAAGLVNTVIEYETGRDVTGNVMAMAFNGEKPEYRAARLSEGPEKQLNQAVKKLEEDTDSLPGSVIGFTDLGYGKRAVYERVPAADGRTAGSMVRKSTEISAPNAAPREPITQLMLDPMPLIMREELNK